MALSLLRLVMNRTPIMRARKHMPPRLLDHPLNPIHAYFQNIHLWPVANPYEMVTWRIKQIPPLRWIQIEEDPRHDNHPLFEQRIKEAQPMREIHSAVLG